MSDPLFRHNDSNVVVPPENLNFRKGSAEDP